MSTGEKLLSVEDLAAGYDAVTVIHDIDLEVADGETVVLIGPNGHGKTTVLWALTGLINTRAGRITFAGEEITGLSAEKITERGIVHVPQGDHLFSDLTVEENLLLGSFPGRSWKQRKAALHRVSLMFPVLAERRGQRARTLSGGERRQVAIGRGLMRNPRLLIIDEPSLGLAPVVVKTVYEVITRIAAEEGTSILLAEENFRHIEGLADTVGVLEMGRIIRRGTPTELANDPEIASAYLGGALA